MPHDAISINDSCIYTRLRKALGLHASGFTTRITGMEFDPSYPHTYCRICGDIFQHEDDRNPFIASFEFAIAANTRRRQLWSQSHAKTHSDSEHAYLQETGLWLTPEAAYKLVPFGIIPIGQAVFDADTLQALKESPATPSNDVIS